MSLNYQVLLSSECNRDKFASDLLGNCRKISESVFQTDEFSLCFYSNPELLKQKSEIYDIDISFELDITVLIPVDENFEELIGSLLGKILSLSDDDCIFEANDESPFLIRVRNRVKFDPRKTVITASYLGIKEFDEVSLPTG